jgi:hypothetical protein
VVTCRAAEFKVRRCNTKQGVVKLKPGETWRQRVVCSNWINLEVAHINWSWRHSVIFIQEWEWVKVQRLFIIGYNIIEIISHVKCKNTWGIEWRDKKGICYYHRTTFLQFRLVSSILPQSSYFFLWYFLFRCNLCEIQDFLLHEEMKCDDDIHG